MTDAVNRKDDEHDTFPIVALCASAGGLDALRTFFKTVPTSSEIAFIVVQHQHEQQESILSNIIQRDTSIKVVTIADEMTILPRRIYVLPSGYDVAVSNGRFRMGIMKRSAGWPDTIDRFLKSLADDQRERVTAIILSGVGADGTEGARQVRANGGLVIAQNPKTALQDGMPSSVIGAGVADAVLAPGEMPNHLLNALSIDLQQAAPPVDFAASISENDLEQIVRQLQRQGGRDFTDYKTSTMRRQITRRMSTVQQDSVSAYLDYMEQHPEEVDKLSRYLLINVTSFFRDPEAFESLKNDALLPLLRQVNIDELFRAWVPGCATGEEAISLAILIHESLRELDIPDMEVRIFASDANRELLQQGRSGFYPRSITEDISASRLRDHFVESEGGYRVRNHIKRMLIWSEQNLIEHPPFSQLHLISCRNVLIYFQKGLQDRVFSLFQFALREGGILFLGSSETMPSSGDEFAPIDTKHKVYRKTPGASRTWIQLDQPLFKRLPDFSEEPMPAQPPSKRGDESRELEVIKEMLIEYYSPTSMIVDENYQVRYTFGEIDRYLRFATGVYIQRSVLEFAREGLDTDLTIALHDAFTQDKDTIVRRDVWVKTNGKERIINLIVEPIREGQLGNRLKLVIFELLEEGQNLRSNEVLSPSDDAKDDETRLIIARLRQELEQTQSVLQSTTQALQAKSEELITSMEEIRSANEEVQTTNEELRTSKEELESMNEELNTLNTQLTDQNHELTRAKNTLNNFLQSTEIGMIFLDQDLMIREYTSAVTSIFGLRRSDVGRPLSEIAAMIPEDDLIADAEQVLETLVNVEKEVITTDSRWYDVRIRPYRTTSNIIDGLVLTFSDITRQKKTQASLKQSKARFRGFVTASSDVIYRMDPDWQRMLYMKGREFIPDTDKPDATWLDVYVHPDDRDVVQRTIAEAIRTKDVFDLEHRVFRVDGRIGWTHARAVPLLDDDGEIREWFGTASDITERKRTEQQIQQTADYQRQLIDTIENSLIELDRDLRVIDANEAFYETFSVSETETIGRQLYDLGNGQWDIPDLRLLLTDIIPQQTIVRAYEVTHDFPDLGVRTMRLNARQVDTLERILLVITEIST